MSLRAERSGLIEIAGRRLEVLELAGAPGADAASPIVLLHEGLGSIGLWRKLPEQLAASTGRRVVAYSRSGYGASDPAPLPRPVRYMHEEALEVLPAALDRFGLKRPVLVGHSDGASIALVHAGGSGREVAGLALLAPHVLVEERSLEGIRAAREAYLHGDLRSRLARHHSDVDNAFWGWNDVWLSPGFREWNLESYLPAVSCPVLVVQGEDDPYGTTLQVDRIAEGCAGPVTVRVLAACGHAPHLEQTDETVDAITGFVRGLGS